MGNPLGKTGNPLNGIVGLFKKGYYAIEDRYYAVLDRINKHVPVYKVIDPVDKVVPSFAVLISLLLLIAVYFIFLFSIAPSLTATIRVVDGKGDLLDGVSILLLVGAEEKSLFTDDFGEASLGISSEEVLADASFSKDGFQRLERQLTLLGNETTSVTMQAIPPVAQFENAERTIRVFDSGTNRAIKGVTLGFECTSGGLAPQTQSGDSGEFRVVQPSNCPSMVATAEAYGYSKASKSVAQGVTYIGLSPKVVLGSIAATVVDADGSPVPDVTVRAVDESKNTEEASSSSSLNGTAVLQNLQPGSYSVSAISDDGRAGSEEGVSVSAGETTNVTISLPNADQADVGKIYLKLMEQGTSDPVSNAQVFIYDKNSLLDSTSSNSIGMVEKRLPNKGLDYLVVIMHPDFVTKIEPNVPLKAISDSTPLNVPLVRADSSTSAEARVTVVDEDDKPVGGALVTIYDSRYPRIPLKAPPGVTLSEGELKGTYTLTNLAPAAYFAMAESDDGKSNGRSAEATAVAGQTLELAVKIVLGEGTVETLVFNKGSASHEPIAGATVDLFDANGSGTILSSCVTDAKGKCKSAQIPADRVVFARARAESFISEWAVQTVDIVDGRTASVSIGLTPEADIPSYMGSIGTEFEGLYADASCKTAAGFVQSDESGTTTYFARFSLVFTGNVSYKDVVQHLRAGQDSELNIPLPTGYKLKLIGVSGPLIESAPLSRCWNNDAENPFMEPFECSGGVVPAADGSAKQANIYYPDLSGMQIVPFVVEFAVEPGLGEGAELQLHYIAKAMAAAESAVTQKKLKIFLVGQALCEKKNFAWGFWARDSNGSVSALSTVPGVLNGLSMNANYSILYKAYNCSNADYSNAVLSAKNTSPFALSFTSSEPFDYGPKEVMPSFSFPKDTEISGSVPVYSALEAQSTSLEFGLGTQAGNSAETIGFAVQSSLLLRVDHAPQKLNPNFGDQSLSGKAMDAILQESKPIAGARVNLRIDEARSMTTVTDNGGNFTFTGISDLAGLSSVVLTVRKAGYRTLVKEIAIGASPPVQNPSLGCITITRGGSADVNIFFEKPASGSDVPIETFSVLNGCVSAVTIRIESELETDPKTDFILNAGASKSVGVYAETRRPNPPFPIYMGEYGVDVLAKFGNEASLPFAGPVRTARVYVTDPRSAFRLANPEDPENTGAMKSTFDLRAGLDDGLVINKDFAYFEDVSLPRLEKAHDYSPVEERFSLVYSPPSQPGVEVEKQKVFDPNQPQFDDQGKFTLELVDNGGYVFVDWVDFLMTDESHNSGDTHRIWAQTHRNVWANITAQLPYTAAQAVSYCDNNTYGNTGKGCVSTVTISALEALSHPVVDNFGWVDTETYYPQDANWSDEVTTGPIWQGQHNVCGLNLGDFASQLTSCSVENYFQGRQIVPYKIGVIANRIALESSGEAVAKISAARWKYLRTDKDHEGVIDFGVQNNSLMGEAYALIEIEDTTGVSFSPGQEDIVAQWSISKSGTLVVRNEITLLDGKTTIADGEVLAVSVDGSYKVLETIVGACGAVSAASPKNIYSLSFTSDANQVPFTIIPEQNAPSVEFYACSNGNLGSPSYFDVENPGEADMLDFAEPTMADVLLFRNNSGGSLRVAEIKANYMASEPKSIVLGTGTATIPLGAISREFPIPFSDQPLPPGGPLDYYTSVQYAVEDTTPNAIVYFSDTQSFLSPNPFESGAMIVAAASTAEQEGRTQVERFHVRLIGQSQDQCVKGGVMGSTGPGAEPRVMLDWDWSAIGIDSCSTDNEDYIYCDQTQFMVSLVKRLDTMNRLASEDITGNLLALREMQQFQAYLIEDAYIEDFRHDFVEYFKKEFLSGDVLEGEHPWAKYILDPERFSFDTSAASDSGQASPGLVEAGLHEIYVSLDFDDDQFEFFYDSPEKELMAHINVEISKVSDPVTQNPFYYLPFNGKVGMLEDGSFDRQGYGIEFDNSGIPLAIVESPMGVSLETDSSSGRKLVETSLVSGFDALNTLDRGIIMKIGQNQEIIGFAPSTAAPILLQMSPKEGKVEAYYWLRDETGNVPISGTQFLNIWNGAGSTMKSATGACVDYYGNELEYGIPDNAAESGTCASNVDGSYGFSYNPAGDGQLFLETVFYVPESLAINLRKSCGNNSNFYSPSQGTSTTNTPVSLGPSAGMPSAATIENVFGLIADEYVCVSSDQDYYYFWWNPQKVLSGLDAAKSGIEGWDEISCSPAQPAS